MKKAFLPVLLLFTGTFACTDHKRPEPVPATACQPGANTFAGQVNPIVQQNCATPGCHVAGGAAPGDFTSYTGLKEKVNNGSFRQLVLEEKRMPPTPPGPLTEQQLKTLECWLNAGAPND